MASTSSCAIVHDSDEEFGEICVPNMVEGSKQTTELPSQRNWPQSFGSFNAKTATRIVAVNRQICRSFFSEIPGLTSCVEHCVELIPGFKPKRMRAYKVPEKLQPEVERQLQEMLANGIIRESMSSKAAPLVCLLKYKNGSDGVRSAIGYIICLVQER